MRAARGRRRRPKIPAKGLAGPAPAPETFPKRLISAASAQLRGGPPLGDQSPSPEKMTQSHRNWPRTHASLSSRPSGPPLWRAHLLVMLLQTTLFLSSCRSLPLISPFIPLCYPSASLASPSRFTGISSPALLTFPSRGGNLACPSRHDQFQTLPPQWLPTRNRGL